MILVGLVRSKGIKREYSNARTPQQIGVAGRKNRTLIEAARTMLVDSFLPNIFCAEAISTSCKFAEKSDEGFLVGYSLSSKAFRPITTENKANHTTCSKETNNSAVDKENQAFLEELERLKRQEKEATDTAETLRKTFAQSTEDLLLQAGVARASSTTFVNTATTPLNAASTPTNQDDSQIPAVKDIYDHSRDGIFIIASYDDEGAMADFTNLETIMNASPIPTSRIHFIHPTTQILGDPTSAV
nr:ribonuclease H-like domain-containing protein [Tanacetum cinerariifolium]